LGTGAEKNSSFTGAGWQAGLLKLKIEIIIGKKEVSPTKILG
jgi:hypothetical protein